MKFCCGGVEASTVNYDRTLTTLHETIGHHSKMESLSPSQTLSQKRKLRKIELQNIKIILSRKRKLRKIELQNIKIQLEKRRAEIELEMQYRRNARLQKNMILRREIDLIHANATIFCRQLSRDEWEDIDSVSTLYLPHGFTRITKNFSSTRNANWITSSTIFVRDKHEFMRIINESLEHYKYIHETFVWKRTHKMRNYENEKILKDLQRYIIDIQYRKIIHHVIFSNFLHELNHDCIACILDFLSPTIVQKSIDEIVSLSLSTYVKKVPPPQFDDDDLFY